MSTSEHLEAAVKGIVSRARLGLALGSKNWRDSLSGWDGKAVNAMALALFVYAVCVFANDGDAKVYSLISNILSLAFNVFSVFFAARILFHPNLSGKLRRAWLWLPCSFSLYTSGNAFWLYHENILEVSPAYTWIDALYLSSYLFLLFGLLYFPQAFRNKNERRSFWFDTFTILVGGGMGLWYFFISPVVQTEHHGSYETIIALAYPLVDFVLLFAFAMIGMRRVPAEVRRTVIFFAVALFCNFVGDIIYGIQTLKGEYQSGGVADLLFNTTFFSYTLAGFYQYRELSQTGRLHLSEGGGETADASMRFTPLPYLGIVAGYGMLLYVVFAHWQDDGWQPINLMVICSFVLTVFVILRQQPAVSENMRLHAERVMLSSEARFAALVRHSSDVISIVDRNLKVLYLSPSVERVFGITPEQYLGHDLSAIVHREDRARFRAYFKQLCASQTERPPLQIRMRNSHGEWRNIESVGKNMLDDKLIGGIVFNSRDITERVQAEEKLVYGAFHDALTGLPNRALFLDHLRLAINRSARCLSCDLAVLFIDLDRFKFINDSLGHLAGDKLLIEIARRIQKSVRPSDTVARLGGDEFTVLIEDVNSTESAALIAERLQKEISAPFELDGREVYTTASIGIAFGHSRYERAQDLLRDADTAMYHAKENGKARYEVFDEAMHEEVTALVETEHDLRRAIERNEFFLVYQPIVSLETQTIVGFEALVRWQHPERGLILPGNFIPLAEETGMIIQIGSWVLQEVCRQMRRWRSVFDSSTLEFISLNISSKHFQQPDLVEQIAETLHAAGLKGSDLKLEITERAVMEETERTTEKLRQLRALRVTLSLDDFGTGYSSLSYLHRFPLDVLKIDRSFIIRLDHEVEHHEIVRTIIQLARSLNMKTVAEGVETREQAKRLRELGCDFAQGFLFAKPVSSADAEEMLSRRTNIKALAA